MSINFTRKTDYALVALASMAQEAASGNQQPQSARQIARRRGLPEPLLMNLMKQLHEAGLLRSRRGIGGGYWLAKAPQLISVAEVLEAIEGPMRLSFCCQEEADDACPACQVEPDCPITHAVRHLHQKVVHLLRDVSIEDLRAQQPGFETPRVATTLLQPLVQVTAKGA